VLAFFLFFFLFSDFSLTLFYRASPPSGAPLENYSFISDCFLSCCLAAAMIFSLQFTCPIFPFLFLRIFFRVSCYLWQVAMFLTRHLLVFSSVHLIGSTPVRLPSKLIPSVEPYAPAPICFWSVYHFSRPLSPHFFDCLSSHFSSFVFLALQHTTLKSLFFSFWQFFPQMLFLLLVLHSSQRTVYLSFFFPFRH